MAQSFHGQPLDALQGQDLMTLPSTSQAQPPSTPDPYGDQPKSTPAPGARPSEPREPRFHVPRTGESRSGTLPPRVSLINQMAKMTQHQTSAPPRAAGAPLDRRKAASGVVDRSGSLPPAEADARGTLLNSARDLRGAESDTATRRLAKQIDGRRTQFVGMSGTDPSSESHSSLEVLIPQTMVAQVPEEKVQPLQWKMPTADLAIFNANGHAKSNRVKVQPPPIVVNKPRQQLFEVIAPPPEVEEPRSAFETVRPVEVRRDSLVEAKAEAREAKRISPRPEPMSPKSPKAFSPPKAQSSPEPEPETPDADREETKERKRRLPRPSATAARILGGESTFARHRLTKQGIGGLSEEPTTSSSKRRQSLDASLSGADSPGSDHRKRSKEKSSEPRRRSEDDTMRKSSSTEAPIFEKIPSTIPADVVVNHVDAAEGGNSPPQHPRRRKSAMTSAEETRNSFIPTPKRSEGGTSAFSRLGGNMDFTLLQTLEETSERGSVGSLNMKR